MTNSFAFFLPQVEGGRLRFSHGPGLGFGW